MISSVASPLTYRRYCGPYWSDGKVQTSVASGRPATDEFDETCKQHDAVYASKSNLLAADQRFYQQNIGKGYLRSLAALVVGGQSLLRSANILSRSHVIMTKTKTAKLRGGNPNPPPSIHKSSNNTPKLSTGKGQNIQMISAPAAVGYGIQLRKPTVKHGHTTSKVVGSDYGGTVAVINTTTYEPACSIPINPSYFSGAMLGSQARAYQRYRFTRFIVVYVPSVPTDLQGQLVMTSSSSMQEPFLDGSSTSFLSRALSTGNAIASPLWSATTLNVPLDSEWRLTDPLLEGDLSSSISDEVQVYGFSTTTLNAGTLICHYEVEFKDPYYTFHSTSIPISVGISPPVSWFADSAVNAVNDAVRTYLPGSITGAGVGAIFRAVFRQAASTLATGWATWSVACKVATLAAVTSSTTSVDYTNISMTPGTTLYINCGASVATFYTSYEDAASGGINGMLVYRTATTADSVFSFFQAQVRLSPALMITTQ